MAKASDNHGKDEQAGPIDRAFRSTVGRESTTFGFSILVTVVFGVVQSGQGSASSGDLLLYATGAVMSFTLLEAGLSRGFRRRMPQHDSQVVAAGTALNIFSVLVGVLVGIAVTAAIGPDIAWLVAPFAAGLVYLTFESLEVAAVERVLRRAGQDRHADEVRD